MNNTCANCKYIDTVNIPCGDEDFYDERNGYWCNLLDEEIFCFEDGRLAECPYLFSYKNNELIKFFKCKTCGDIITGCISHHMEYCSCENFVDQEDVYTRASGSWDDITDQLSNDQKRKIFTKTVFNADNSDESFIKHRLKHPYYYDTMFDLSYYKQLYKQWKKERLSN